MQCDRIGEMVSKGDAAFAYETFQVFLRRIDERLTLADELLADRHGLHGGRVDGSRSSPLALCPGFRRSPAKLATAHQVRPAGVEDGRNRRDGAVEALHNRYREFGQRMHATDHDGLLEAYLTALGRALDPQTDYLSPTTLAGFRTGPIRAPVGIGVQLRLANGYTEINEIVADSPAEQAGELRPGDRIAAVAQTDAASWADALRMSPSAVYAELRGRPGTAVLVKAITPAFQWKTVRIERREREARPGDLPREVFRVESPNGTPLAVGVVNLSRPYWTSLNPDEFSLVKSWSERSRNSKQKGPTRRSSICGVPGFPPLVRPRPSRGSSWVQSRSCRFVSDNSGPSCTSVTGSNLERAARGGHRSTDATRCGVARRGASGPPSRPGGWGRQHGGEGWLTT